MAERSSRKITVIIPSHNARDEIFAQVAQHLLAQTLEPTQWEVLIVDSASQPPLEIPAVLAPLSVQLIRLETPGLTKARVAGIQSCCSEFLVFLDDDMFLAPDFLAKAVTCMEQHENVACLGGRIEGAFECTPPAWTHEFHTMLAINDFGPEILISQTDSEKNVCSYPAFAPVGGGMVLRKTFADRYAENPASLDVSDRFANSFSSAGDCDINLQALNSGWSVAYTPELLLQHFIPRHRLEKNYLANLAYGIARSWVLVLNRHGICPWPATRPIFLLARIVRAYFRHQAYRGADYFVRWRAACGHLSAQAALSTLQKTQRTKQCNPATGGSSCQQIEAHSFLKPNRFGLGRLLYLCYYKPKRQLLELKCRGIRNAFTSARNKKSMEKKAISLSCSTAIRNVHLIENQKYTFSMLSGSQYWYQSFFCLASLGTTVSVNLYDDGTLLEKHKAALCRTFPNLHLISAEHCAHSIETMIPIATFPYLRRLRDSYPHIRKLVDIHCHTPGWNCVLDSDMLFFSPPKELLDCRPDMTVGIALEDIQDSYGYSTDTLRNLCGKNIPKRINVGVMGIHSCQIDWQEIESWCRTLIENHGMHYCLEQAISAMLLARTLEFSLLNREHYQVMPAQVPSTNSKVVLQHYVADSKHLYFNEAWQCVSNLLAKNGECPNDNAGHK